MSESTTSSGKGASGWTPDILREFFANQMLERKGAVDDRLTELEAQFHRGFTAAQDLFDRTIAQMDLRYQQRFDAQGEAVAAALVSAEKAVNSALVAADRAVAKAEIAAEKRFEAVNEFRGTLADQASMLLPRSEADARFQAISDGMSSLGTNIAKIELELRSVSTLSVHREDLKPINDALDKLRDIAATSGGKDVGGARVVSVAAAGLALLVSFAGVYIAASRQSAPVTTSATLVPAVVDNTKRVDDLIVRLDSLQRALIPSSPTLPPSR